MAGAEGQKLDKSTSSDVWKKMLNANEASMHSSAQMTGTQSKQMWCSTHLLKQQQWA
jgi:hypothetical protein